VILRLSGKVRKRKKKPCSVELEPTQTATRSWNDAQGPVIGLFHVTC